ncbi:MAG TPA: hypothetical protein VFL60_01255 [Gaiellaceae bacterium]|nr:hypothetical protein [Gaiellaceae bacterium]
MHEYWLANCEGFSIVRGSARARVTGVVVDPSDGRARSVLARSGTRGKVRAVPAARVAAVDPFEKVLYLERRVRPGSVTVPIGRVAGGASALARDGAVRCRGGAAWAAPRVRAGGRATAVAAGRASVLGAQRTRAAAEWCRPRAAASGRASALAARRAALVSRDWSRRRLAALRAWWLEAAVPAARRLRASVAAASVRACRAVGRTAAAVTRIAAERREARRGSSSSSAGG